MRSELHLFEAWTDDRLTAHGTSGPEILVDCPWCGRPKMYVNRRKGAFFCQRCLEKGGATRLVAKVEGESIEHAERRLKGRPGNSASLRDRLHEVAYGHWSAPDEFINYSLPDGFTPCFNGLEWRVPEYLEAPVPDGRQVSDRMITRHGVGYALEGKYRNRIIIPIIQGERRAFLARLMGKPRGFRWRDKVTGKWVEPPKYLTPRNAGLSTVVYWLDATPEGVDIVVVEGIFDAMRLIDLGFYAVATFGKYMSPVQQRALLAKSPRSITFLRDADATAQGWAEARALRRVAGSRAMAIKVAECPGDDDPDSIGARGGRAAIAELLEAAATGGDRTAELLSSLRSIRKH